MCIAVNFVDFFGREEYCHIIGDKLSSNMHRSIGSDAGLVPNSSRSASKCSVGVLSPMGRFVTMALIFSMSE